MKIYKSMDMENIILKKKKNLSKVFGIMIE